MAIVIPELVSLEDLDEAMSHVQNMLALPGMERERRNILLSALDDLLDARLEITQEAEFLLRLESEASNADTRSGANNAKALSK
jgi:hypothetical protein